MKILLTGATGYIGKRLLSALVQQGMHVVCCVRDVNRFHPLEVLRPHLTVIEVDLLDPLSLERIPKDIDAAYYLVHSMSSSKNYEALEQRSALNFRKALTGTSVKQVIYLSGIINDNALSQHLNSRRKVELELKKGSYHLTTLRAGIIIGSGSASFEIIRDLVEKLPVMITPKWLNTNCQPIAIADVIYFMTHALLNERTYDESFDIGGQDILTYKQMLLLFAQVRGLKRGIYTLPVMTPRLSSYWLYFVTSTSYKLAIALVDSMKVEVVCKGRKLTEIIPREVLSYEEALERAFAKIERNAIASSWKDAFASGDISFTISDFIQVPVYGCFIDRKSRNIIDRAICIERLWQIGGERGWYYATWLWKLRGIIDKVFGGVGLKRGRTNSDKITAGDAIDFWRVLYANKTEGRLLLFAEMKLPGEAWLDFHIKNGKLHQVATFRPKGLLGRIYWYMVLPFHGFIFNGMIRKITQA